MSLLWWMALSSRCFAPCCCHLDDVECPCAPCKTFHFLDVPFFVGVSIAWMASQGFFLRDVLLALSMALLLLAIPSGFMKWRWMKDMKAATPRPQVTHTATQTTSMAATWQMVGNPVTITTVGCCGERRIKGMVQNEDDKVAEV